MWPVLPRARDFVLARNNQRSSPAISGKLRRTNISNWSAACSIRQGIGHVVRQIEAGTFGNAYRGSPLETVVKSIAEQPDIQGRRSGVIRVQSRGRIPEERISNLRIGPFRGDGQK
jgi:hypothetical protein